MLGQSAAVARLGNDHCQTRIAGYVPADFARIYRAVAIGVLEIIRNPITIVVLGIAVRIGCHVMVADVHGTTVLRSLIGLGREVI